MTAIHPAKKHLRRATLAKTPRGLMSALWELREYYPERPFAELPVSLQVIQLVTQLEMANQYDSGIASILEDDDEPELGAFVPTASAWLADVGATQASSYLARAVALFPKGRIAKSPIKRAWQIEAIRRRSETVFEDVDREFGGWAAQLRPGFQRYLKTDERLILAALRTDEPEEPSAPSAQELLAVRDASDCLDGLADAIHRSGARARPRSETAEMIMLFWEIDLYAGHGDGLWKFLDRGHIRDELDRAERWCERIGASEAVRYFREYRSAFPNGSIPKTFTKRSAILEREDSRLGRIDAKHADAIPKLTRRFVAFLRSHPELVDEAIGA
jgi:hypothetical protein